MHYPEIMIQIRTFTIKHDDVLRYSHCNIWFKPCDQLKMLNECQEVRRLFAYQMDVTTLRSLISPKGVLFNFDLF